MTRQIKHRHPTRQLSCMPIGQKGFIDNGIVSGEHWAPLSVLGNVLGSSVPYFFWENLVCEKMYLFKDASALLFYRHCRAVTKHHCLSMTKYSVTCQFNKREYQVIPRPETLCRGIATSQNCQDVKLWHHRTFLSLNCHVIQTSCRSIACQLIELVVDGLPSKVKYTLLLGGHRQRATHRDDRTQRRQRRRWCHQVPFSSTQMDWNNWQAQAWC